MGKGSPLLLDAERSAVVALKDVYTFIRQTDNSISRSPAEKLLLAWDYRMVTRSLPFKKRQERLFVIDL